MNAPRAVRGSAVAASGRALLILGPVGAGKSSLALDLIALGAALVADDATCLETRGDEVIASCPPAGAGLIEARGVGLLRLAPAPPTPVALVLDLAPAPAERLPESRVWAFRGVELPLIRRSGRIHPAAIYLALQNGGPLDPDAPLTLARCGDAAHSCAGRAESARGSGAGPR